MAPHFQESLADLGAYDIIKELEEVYNEYRKSERIRVIRLLHEMKMDEDQTVSSHVDIMKWYFDYLDRLCCAISNKETITLVINSLAKTFDGYVKKLNKDYNEITLSELLAMLVNTEENLSCDYCGFIDHPGGFCPKWIDEKFLTPKSKWAIQVSI